MLRWLACALVGGILLAGCGGADDPGAARVAALVPDPATVVDDKGEVILDGCRSGMEYTDAWTCVYGDPDSDTTVVLWGDSHAMQFSPPLIRLAEKNGWRLVALFRGSCLTADATFQPACDAWRANALDRISKEEPDLIVTATDTGNGYALKQDGVQLSRDESGDLLREAYSRTLAKLSDMTGNRPGGVIVLRDFPRAEEPPPDCLVRHPERPERCAFTGTRKDPPGFDLESARETDGVRLIDPGPVVCPGGSCPAARDGIVVFRDTAHLSATYALTLADWLEEQIGEIPAHGGRRAG